MSKKRTPLWREAHFQGVVVEKARRCGTKHISKSKVLKTDGLGPLLEVQMSKKRTPLWREAHFKSKCTKLRVLSLF